MTRIDSVSAQPDRVGRYTVRFNDGTVMRLYRQTVEDFGICSGAELSAQQLEALISQAGAMSAKMRAVRIVSATNVSKSDLEQRLIRKGEDAQQAKDAVQWMSDLDLLDDQRTAEQIVRKCIGKGYGLARAKQALYEKRIPKQYWQAVLEDYPDQSEKIVSYLRAHLGEQWQERDLRRVMDALLRRGHSYSEIRRALEQLSLDTDDFPEE